MKSKINFNTTKKIIILSTILSIIIVAISIFLVLPYFTQIKEQNTKIKDQRIQLEIYEQQRKNIDKTRSDLKNIENDINNISLVFINQEDILDFLDSLDEIAKTNNLTQKINISNINKIEVDKYVQISVSIDGQWQDIITYLSTLEKLDYYIILDNLNFNKKNELINLTFTATIFSS